MLSSPDRFLEKCIQSTKTFRPLQFLTNNRLRLYISMDFICQIRHEKQPLIIEVP